MQKGLVQMEAWSSSAEGPRPNGGMEQACRRASSKRGHGVVVQRASSDWRPGAHLCCSETLLLCLSISLLNYN